MACKVGLWQGEPAFYLLVRQNFGRPEHKELLEQG